MKDDIYRTRKDYLNRVNNVLDYIESNLDSELSLQNLSKIANYSPFHFHRVFSTIIGENPNQYVTRKRVERIASILITKPNETVKFLANSYGFNSESSFSRTFKKYYGVSPTKFKSECKSILSKIGIDLFSSDEYFYSIDKINKWIEMNSNITITDLEEIKLVGITRIGELEKAEGAFQKLMNWAHKLDAIDQTKFKAITIYHDNPNVTPLDKVRYSSCITINKDLKEHEDIRTVELNGGIFVIGSFEIIGSQIAEAWKNMNIWVIENGYQFRDSDFFEVYHNDHRNHTERKFLIDICIPIEFADNVIIDKSVRNIFFKQKENKTSKKEDYHFLISYMKELKAHFSKEYELEFKMGNLNQSSKDYTYFSITTAGLKKIKLKYVIILDHIRQCFDICLSGQNKDIRKKYWNLFKGSDWNKFHIAESMDNNLMIVDHTLIENPNFGNTKDLTEEIEKESIKFIKEMNDILE